MRLRKEAGLSYHFPVAVAGVQIHPHFEGGACPSFYLARPPTKERNRMFTDDLASASAWRSTLR